MTARPTAILLALEAALMEGLAVDAELRGLVRGRIHDGSPRGAVMPYLAFGAARCDDFSSGDGAGASVSLTLEAVAADGERQRAIAILDAGLACAFATSVALASGTLVLLSAGETTIARTSDERAWRAAAVLTALVDG